ncbi:MAG TPA: DUF378 domain-containing protein [Clostridiaceae bacterium]|jgi:uncharacterized membrane protein YuzA (DUF378 family)|nr:DUF378 domain-containing protein [Clostridiaceae bacterium]
MRLDTFDWTALVLVIVGALNWGLIGLFNFDIVAFIFGGSTAFLTKIVYGLIGLAGAYIIYLLRKLKRA